MGRARSVRVATFVVAMLAAFSVLSPAGATDGNGCPSGGNTWVRRRTCIFLAKGFPIVFHGATTKGPTATNTIRVWVAPKGYPDVVIAECRAAGATPRCEGAVPNSTTMLDVFPAGVEKPALECHVQGTGEGTFYCQSGTNR